MRIKFNVGPRRGVQVQKPLVELEDIEKDQVRMPGYKADKKKAKWLKRAQRRAASDNIKELDH